MSQSCRICSNSTGNRTYECQERMFGWGDKFLYFQCGKCGCLQIAEVPKDLGRFYPGHYYSFHSENARDEGIKSRLAAIRDRSSATGQGMLRKVLEQISPPRPDLKSVGQIPLRIEDRILDVGCGRGQLLSYLHRAGFRHLAGIDPYMPEDFTVATGVVVRKMSLEQCTMEFDVIMLHHVFEHLDAPLKTLQDCARSLSPHGKIFLRFPTVESEAWERYGEKWVQLDAPRHLFLHSRRSLEILADQSNLKIEKWWYDSTAFQFWGSELYQKQVPLTAADGQTVNPALHFTKAQMDSFESETVRMNQLKRGDQVAVVLSVCEIVAKNE